MKKEVIIAGAGLFGATCARILADDGYKVTVYEKSRHIAGSIYTESKRGIIIHKHGAHIFHTSDPIVWLFVNRFCRFENFINSPIAKYKNEVYNLPFNMNTFVRLWKDVSTVEDAKKKIEQETIKYADVEPKNLEEQALKLVGKTVYKKLIKEYTEKQWGKKCSSLPAFIIKRLPLRFTFNNNYFNDLYQGIPEHGYTHMIEKMLSHKNIKVHLNREFTDVMFRRLKNEKIVIFSGRIDEFFNLRFGALDFRSVKHDEVWYHCDDYQGNAVVNYTSHDVVYTRSIEHKHFSPRHQNKGETIVSYERSLKYNFFDETLIPDYPINDETNTKLLHAYQNLARLYPTIFFGGRLGSYKYLDMDKTIMEAMNLCEKVEKYYEQKNRKKD